MRQTKQGEGRRWPMGALLLLTPWLCLSHTESRPMSKACAQGAAL